MQTSNLLSEDLGWTILENQPLSVVVWKKKGELIYSNKLARETFSTADLKSLLLDYAEDPPLIRFKGRIFRCSYTSFESYRICHLEDISEVRKLAEMKEDLEIIFNSSFDEIFVTDGQGVVLRVNSAGEKQYGLNSDEMVGRKAQELSGAGYFSPSLTPDIIKHKQRKSIAQTTRDGRTLYVTGNPVLDETGKLIRIIFNCRDLTEIKQMEKRLEETESLLSSYRSELVELTKGVDKQMVVESPIMQGVIEVISKVAHVDSTILITGESGVGKSNIAKLIHEWSPRKNGPFIQVNCGVIPETLFESELFGYEYGAFTGARKEGKKGLVEAADEGTLFLDEIGELPMQIQVKLLEIIQEQQYRRVGSDKLRKSNIRIVAATNKDLKKLLLEGKFREDLFFRLNVIPIHIPPLRHRTEEIPHLINLYLNKFNQKYGLGKQVDPLVRQRFLSYPWPGNIRELENLMERMVLTSGGANICQYDLPEMLQTEKPKSAITVHRVIPLKQAVEYVEAELLRRTFKEFGSTYRIAEVLGVNQSTIVRKVSKYENWIKGEFVGI
ncbi:sigma-54 interaction domain-containing protein [Neobacillus sp. NRS-1170]|uniref:sigma-54 interaction domain-containing protein n=1 Tax=Neobacillus sp. NRS-1170 TaxID=3233898 RepID=UPI003D2A6D9D